jgi:hypothetical protein
MQNDTNVVDELKTFQKSQKVEWVDITDLCRYS